MSALTLMANPGAAEAGNTPLAAPGGPRPRRPLRIAMVHLSDPRLDSRIQRLAGALAQRGDEVDLICLGEREETRVGAGVIRVHPIRIGKPSGGGASHLAGYARFLAGATRRLTGLDLRQRYDVIEIHNMPDILTAAAIGPRLRGTPVILNMHDTFPELFATMFGRPSNDPLVRLVRGQERVGTALADRLITVTSEAQDRLASRGVGVGRTTVVMNSPDEGVFGPPRPPAPLPDTGPIRMLYHGGLAPRYGLETLIQSFARLQQTEPRLHLRICGFGADRDRLAQLAAEIAPGRIDIPVEPVPFARIPEELAAAHIGVVPTTRDDFTELLLPVKLLEYVHMGLPVVASRLPGIGGYFPETELHAFTPGDPDDLAATVEALLARPDVAQERAVAASHTLESLTWERERERYLALVDELAAQRATQLA